MTWPTRTWTQDGWQDFKSPWSDRRPEGLEDIPDWEDHVGEVERGKDDHEATFWDVIDNPLYEAAANASDIDWDQWVADSIADIGDYEETHTFDAEGYYDAMDEWNNDEDAGRDEKPDKDDYMTGPGYSTDDDQRDWGISSGSVTKDLDTMHDWLRQTIKTHDQQDAPIIRRGPQGSDYGIDGDIWEHYGLDQAPGPPAEMDINYEFNLLDAIPSTHTYATPSGFPPVDLYTESISGPTSYDTYMDDRRAEYEAFHDPNKPATSYGEVIVPEVEESEEETTTEPTYTWHSDSYSFSGDSRWTDNVQKIIGNDQDVALWAEFAGVTNLNSRNDSNTIKELFNANNGVLPTTRD